MTTPTIPSFDQFPIRRVYDETKGKRYFSVIDIVKALLDSPEHDRAKTYWTTLKNRLKNEWSEVVIKCDQLKMIAQDGKMRLTDVADAETILRLIQSVPSPKAEPIKLRLAKVGYERMQETVDPALSVERARQNRQNMGRSDKRIQQRMTGQETRNKLNDYPKEAWIKEGDEFAILTNIIHQERTGMTVKEHKTLKNLKSQNLRDHMSEAELIFTALAELSTRQIAQSTQATGLVQNKVASKKWWAIAKNARKALEQKTGTNVITGENFLPSKRTKKKK